MERQNSDEEYLEKARNLIAQMILLAEEDQKKRGPNSLKVRTNFRPREIATLLDQKPAPKLLKSAGRVRAENGDGSDKILEPQVLCISRACKRSWTREALDLAPLAKLRWFTGSRYWKIEG